MKSLFIGFNRSYTNPTAETWLRCIGSATSLSFFGPGYSSTTILKNGVENYIEKNGPFDFLFCDSFVFESDNILKRERPFIGDHIRFNPKEYKLLAYTFMKFFLNYSGKKIFLVNWDSYGITKEMMKRVIDSNTYIWDAGHSLQMKLDDIASIYGTKASGTDKWYELTNNYKERVIAVPHTLGSMEFDFSPLNNRKVLFDVIGTGYPERAKAKKVLPLKMQFYDILIRIKNRLYFDNSTSMTDKFLTELRRSYMNKISLSIFCYCSGGPWLYPVRKYFEIPARGAVAIGWPCVGFNALGFIDGVNYIVSKDNSTLKEIIDEYDIDKIQSIANEGRKLMWSSHSEFARTIQIKESLEKILMGSFKGSYWEKGDYKHY